MSTTYAHDKSISNNKDPKIQKLLNKLAIQK